MYENELCLPRFLKEKGNEGDFHKRHHREATYAKKCIETKRVTKPQSVPRLNSIKVFPVRPSTVSTHLSESQQHEQTSEIVFIYDISRKNFFRRRTFLKLQKGAITI